MEVDGKAINDLGWNSVDVDGKAITNLGWKSNSKNQLGNKCLILKEQIVDEKKMMNIDRQ